MKLLVCVGLAALLYGALAGASAQTLAPGSQPAGGEISKYAFESNASLAGWTTTRAWPAGRPRETW
jgi:hypothetical protein